MTTPLHAQTDPTERFVEEIEEVVFAAEAASQPLEVDPHRQRLFKLFAEASALGGLADDAPYDLSDSALGRQLSARWDLARGVGDKFSQPSQLPPAHLKRLRSMWSFMRMWFEWTYAWEHWAEHHADADSPR